MKRRTLSKKGPKRKVYEFHPFFVNPGVFPWETSTIHIEFWLEFAPAESSWTDLSLVWFAGTTPEKEMPPPPQKKTQGKSQKKSKEIEKKKDWRFRVWSWPVCSWLLTCICHCTSIIQRWWRTRTNQSCDPVVLVRCPRPALSFVFWDEARKTTTEKQGFPGHPTRQKTGASQKMDRSKKGPPEVPHREGFWGTSEGLIFRGFCAVSYFFRGGSGGPAGEWRGGWRGPLRLIFGAGLFFGA